MFRSFGICRGREKQIVYFMTPSSKVAMGKNCKICCNLIYTIFGYLADGMSIYIVMMWKETFTYIENFQHPSGHELNLK